jgi:thiosulfate reductase cytochrome b subunit
MRADYIGPVATRITRTTTPSRTLQQDSRDLQRHSVVVRLTHWITTISVVGLLVSGIAILLAHPRLYWGETGALGEPSLIDLPLPFVLVGQSGWGRSLHFLSAWVSVVTGVLYVAAGLLSGHFRQRLLIARSDLTLRAFAGAARDHWHLTRLRDDFRGYNLLQRLTYLTVVFVLFPAMIWTGLAMSPAITSVFAVLVTTLGGQQSARTIHFVIGALLVLFVAVHITMVSLAGFRHRMWAMIAGRSDTAGNV